jgi:hypothetical protein
MSRSTLQCNDGLVQMSVKWSAIPNLNLSDERQRPASRSEQKSVHQSRSNGDLETHIPFDG